MEALDGLPPVKVHCSCLAEQAIHAAIFDYAQKNNLDIKGLKIPEDTKEKTCCAGKNGKKCSCSN